MTTPNNGPAESGLVERLRAGPRMPNGRPVGDQTVRQLNDEAAARIQALEAGLREIADDPYQHGQRVQRMKKIAARTLTESQNHD